jgi:hypothetical protein
VHAAARSVMPIAAINKALTCPPVRSVIARIIRLRVRAKISPAALLGLRAILSGTC